jgi:hypothetical protein
MTKRLHAWNDCPSSANELFEIARFFYTIPKHKRDITIIRGLVVNGHMMPASEITKVLDWWYNRADIRYIFESILPIYERSNGMMTKWTIEEWAIGPEQFLIKNWWKLDNLQRTACRKYNRITPRSIWYAMYQSPEPIDDMNWNALDEIRKIIEKYNNQNSLS